MHDYETGLLEMKQGVLIDIVIKALVLGDGSVKVKYNTDESKPLINYEDGMPMSRQFSYISVVGMLMYIYGHTHPDVSYAVKFSSIDMLIPKHSHKLALKRFGCYLKARIDKVLVFNP